MANYLLTTLKGVAMGAADVIPGVSGGTIAFMTGIYQELIDSLKSIDHIALKKVLKLELKSFWSHINGTFLPTGDHRPNTGASNFTVTNLSPSHSR